MNLTRLIIQLAGGAILPIVAGRLGNMTSGRRA